MPESFLTATLLFTVLFHVSNLMAFLAFLLRDQLHLRVMMAVSLLLQALYYWSIPGGPLFDPLFWKVVSFVANLVMIILVFGGKLDFGIPRDMRPLFDKIGVLSPGQFRTLIKISVRQRYSGLPLITEGETPDQLHYLLSGQATMQKGSSTHVLAAGVFLGEIAFLNNTAASATVLLQPGASCVSWPTEHLRMLMQKDRATDIAMRGVFNHDLGIKSRKQRSAVIKKIWTNQPV